MPINVLKPMTRDEITKAVVDEFKLYRVGVYLDATAEFKTGNARKDGKPFTIKNAHFVVKFSDEEEAATLSYELADQQEVESFKKSPKPFKIGDRVVCHLSEMGQENFKPAGRLLGIGLFLLK